MLEKVIGNDKSDLAKCLRLTCETAIADPAAKEKAWNEIINPNSETSNKEKIAMMGGFYAWS